MGAPLRWIPSTRAATTLLPLKGKAPGRRVVTGSARIRKAPSPTGLPLIYRSIVQPRRADEDPDEARWHNSVDLVSPRVRTFRQVELREMRISARHPVAASPREG